GNIIVAAAASTLTGTTLASNIPVSPLTSAAGGTFGSNAYNSTAFYHAGAPQTNITGNAATATLAANSTLWGGASYEGPYLPLAGGSGSVVTGSIYSSAIESLRMSTASSGLAWYSGASNTAFIVKTTGDLVLNTDASGGIR